MTKTITWHSLSPAGAGPHSDGSDLPSHPERLDTDLFYGEERAGLDFEHNADEEKGGGGGMGGGGGGALADASKRQHRGGMARRHSEEA